MKCHILTLLILTATIAASPNNVHNNPTLQTCQTTLDCPPGTLIVSSDPTSQIANFTTLQSAIDSLPKTPSSPPATILLLQGTYDEQINITRSAPITLLGQLPPSSLSSGGKGKDAAFAEENASKNTVRIIHNATNHDATGLHQDNVFTSTLIIAPTLAASLTGSGPTGDPVPEGTDFGNTDFRAYNIDFVNLNEGVDRSNGPALAVSLGYYNAGFYGCGFFSYQDTLRNCGGGITAWKGTNTTFENKYGIYIVDSNISAANSSIAEDIQGKCALGRPWNSLHRSVFANCFEDESIRASGYSDWVVDGVSRITPDTLMAEVEDCHGPGFDVDGRREGGLDVLLDKRVWDEEYGCPGKVFLFRDGGGGNVDWIDWDYEREVSVAL